MKPFVWVTALLLASIFLAGAIFAAVDVLSRAHGLNDPELKVAAGWLVTGLIFLSLGMRGWKTHRRQVHSTKTNASD
jgi:uncharacterized PurR-regulated membrane protein YhhQ (DUF165 family)